MIQTLKKSNPHCVFITGFVSFFFILITADFHIQIGYTHFFLPAAPETR